MECSRLSNISDRSSKTKFSKIIFNNELVLVYWWGPKLILNMLMGQGKENNLGQRVRNIILGNFAVM